MRLSMNGLMSTELVTEKKYKIGYVHSSASFEVLIMLENYLKKTVLISKTKHSCFVHNYCTLTKSHIKKFNYYLKL